MTTVLPFQPDAMTSAHLAAVSYLARYTGHTLTLHAYQLRRWFGGARATTSTRWSGSNEPTSSCSSAASASPG